MMPEMLEINPSALYTRPELEALFSDRLLQCLRAVGMRSPGNSRSRAGATPEPLYLGKNILDALVAVCEARSHQRGLSGREVGDESSDPKMEARCHTERRSSIEAEHGRRGTLLGAVDEIERELRTS